MVSGEYGKTQPLCYCFQPKYWSNQHHSTTRRLEEENIFNVINSCSYIEPVPDEIKDLNKLQLFDIRKTYTVGSKPVEAVKG